MIIDTHVHIGDSLNFRMSGKNILDSMKKHNIRFSIVSSIEATEVDHNQNLIPKEMQVSQIRANRRTIEFAKRNKDKIGVAIWVKPLQEFPDARLERFIRDNREYIYAMKFHPYHSKMSFNSEKIRKFIDLAERFSLPVVTHTAAGYDCSPMRVYEVAKDYPNTKFVMVHMGLGTDYNETFEVFDKKLPNIYGDTTWVNMNVTKKIIREFGDNLVMFGTDNPIDGINTLDKEIYQDYFNKIKKDLTEEEYDKLMYKNALEVFNIKLSE